MVGLIALTTFVLLARALRSLLLPVKAIVLEPRVAWQPPGACCDGLAARARLERDLGDRRDRLDPAWVPLMAFAFLFGLSMDYEVFILTRVREEYDRRGSTDRR